MVAPGPDGIGAARFPCIAALGTVTHDSQRWRYYSDRTCHQMNTPHRTQTDRQIGAFGVPTLTRSKRAPQRQRVITTTAP
jgi:hypothetical protein